MLILDKYLPICSLAERLVLTKLPRFLFMLLMAFFASSNKLSTFFDASSTVSVILVIGSRPA